MAKESNIVQLLNLDTKNLKDLLLENVLHLSDIYDHCQEFYDENKSEEEEQNDYIKLYIGVDGNHIMPLILNKLYFMEYIKKNHELYYELLKQVKDVENAAMNGRIDKDNLY